MKRIKKDSKKGQAFLARYERATAESVRQFYKQPSANKIEIEATLRLQMQREKGRGFKIICGSNFFFTAAWLVPDGLRVETSGDSYILV